MTATFVIPGASISTNKQEDVCKTKVFYQQ